MKVFVDEDRQRVYMVMESVEGRLLRRVMSEQRKFPAERAVKIALRVLDALGYIHSHGVAHRDLKPENIMINTDDNIKLINFGIATNPGARRITFAKLSNTMGTPDYISPEQVKGKKGRWAQRPLRFGRDAIEMARCLSIWSTSMSTVRRMSSGSNPETTQAIR